MSPTLFEMINEITDMAMLIFMQTFGKKMTHGVKLLPLGKNINTNASEYGASITPDGKYLFFNRNIGKVKPTDTYENTNMFWVDAQDIEKLRPKQ